MKTKNSLALVLCSSLLIAASGAQAGGRDGDALLGGVLGGGVGAVIGNHVGGRDGAIIGGALGAATGVYAVTNRHDDGYRRDRHYNGGRRIIYAQPVYYRPQAVYVQPYRYGYSSHGRHGGHHYANRHHDGGHHYRSAGHR